MVKAESLLIEFVFGFIRMSFSVKICVQFDNESVGSSQKVGYIRKEKNMTKPKLKVVIDTSKDSKNGDIKCIATKQNL